MQWPGRALTRLMEFEFTVNTRSQTAASRRGLLLSRAEPNLVREHVLFAPWRPLASVLDHADRGSPPPVAVETLRTGTAGRG